MTVLAALLGEPTGALALGYVAGTLAAVLLPLLPEARPARRAPSPAAASGWRACGGGGPAAAVRFGGASGRPEARP